MWSGALVYPPTPGHTVNRVSFSAEINGNTGSVLLVHAGPPHALGLTVERTYRVNIEAVPQPFGGMRWWWICPRFQERCADLFLPQGGDLFASRLAHRLGYAVQRMSPRDRAITRVRRQRAALGGSANVLGPPPAKPKWMRWATYERKLAEMGVALSPVQEAAERALSDLRGA